tara:strand:- start:260 stop:460 length:201 start_codon:yes stop_codon:yes gene_type:complete
VPRIRDLDRLVLMMGFLQNRQTSAGCLGSRRSQLLSYVVAIRFTAPAPASEMAGGECDDRAGADTS